MSVSFLSFAVVTFSGYDEMKEGETAMRIEPSNEKERLVADVL